MSKPPSDAAAGTSSPKAARPDRSGADSQVATTTSDAGSQTDSGGTPQEHELLQMALLKIKAVLLPPKLHDERHGQSEEAFEELQARLDGVLNKMEQARKLLDEVLRTPMIARCTARRPKSRTPDDVWKNVFECLDRDAFETLQRTYHRFDNIVSRSEAPILRAIDKVTFRNANYILVIPYLRYSKSLKMELVLDGQTDFRHDSVVDSEKLLKLFEATQHSICVVSPLLEMGDVNAKFVEGIIASMKSVRMLDICYGGDAGSVDVDFLLSCSRHGITDIFFDLSYSYKEYAEIGRLNADGIDAFVLAGATDSKHRTIGFDCGFDAKDLVKLLVEEARKLNPCPRFTFVLTGLHNVDLQPLAKFVHGDVLVIDDMRNGMTMELRMEKHDLDAIVRPSNE